MINISWEEAITVRHKVLWPSKDPLFCFVEGDNEAMHFGVVINQKIVSVASLYIDGKSSRLRKFATLNHFQGKGIGSYLLNYLLLHLRNKGINYLWLDARESAIGFYKHFGLNVTSDVFYKSEVSYYKMDIHL